MPSVGLWLLLLFLAACSCVSANRRFAGYTTMNKPKDFEDAFLSTPKLAVKYGYPIETHVTITQDGYVLNIHRIPNRCHRNQKVFLSGINPTQKFKSNKHSYRSIRTSSEEKRLAVLLIPGILSSSSSFVLSGPQRGIALVLADSGYDVWILNPRGSPYSMKNTKIPPSDDRFWNFSWHEIGMYDIPAALDLVTRNTGFRRIPVIGYSMGNTAMMVAGSMIPKLTDRVSLLIALAPTVYMRHTRSPLMRGFSTITPSVVTLTDVLRFHSVNVVIPVNKPLVNICRGAVSQILCKAFIYLSAGADPEQLNTTTLPVIVGHYPATSSINVLLHYGQLVKHGEFRQFDFNFKRNMRRYGKATPPRYNLNKVKFPVALMFGENDLLATEQDVGYLAKQLPNVVDMYRVPWSKFNHIDFLYSVNVRTLVIDHVLELLAKYGPS